jgi:hypothetical protein
MMTQVTLRSESAPKNRHAQLRAHARVHSLSLCLLNHRLPKLSICHAVSEVVQGAYKAARIQGAYQAVQGAYQAVPSAYKVVQQSLCLRGAYKAVPTPTECLQSGPKCLQLESKSDLRNHQAIVQPRLYDSLMVTQMTRITLTTEGPHGLQAFRPTDGG